MRKLIFFLFCLVGLGRATDNPQKVWVSIQYDEHNDKVYFIQDLETGTRCYAITNSAVNASGYAISCVPQKGK